MTRGPNPNRPTTRGSDPNPNSNPKRLTGREIVWKLALTRIPGPIPNRPTGRGIFFEKSHINLYF